MDTMGPSIKYVVSKLANFDPPLLPLLRRHSLWTAPNCSINFHSHRFCFEHQLRTRSRLCKTTFHKIILDKGMTLILCNRVENCHQTDVTDVNLITRHSIHFNCVQVNLFQKHLFLYRVTQNIAKDCSLN